MGTKTFTVREIARVCHEANRALQAALGEAQNGPWDECDSELQASAIDGVVKAIEGTTPEELHESWCNFKREHGWKHGDVKDEDLKTHPCLVPYAQLPEEQKIKDYLFNAIVNALKPKPTLQSEFDKGRFGG